MFSLLIPTGDGEQQTMVIWMEGWREVEEEKMVKRWRRGEESIGVSREGGPNKSVTVGMKTHSHSTFPEVSAIR